MFIFDFLCENLYIQVQYLKMNNEARLFFNENLRKKNTERSRNFKILWLTSEIHEF